MRSNRRASFGALARAHRFRHGPLAARYVAGESHQFVYAIGKSTGNAVRRNRLRRRLRAVLASQQEHFPPGDYLVSAGPAVATMSATELETAIIALAAVIKQRTA